MSRRWIWASIAGAALCVGAVSASSAADSGFCRGYARAAVREVNEALEHRSCREMIAGQGDRWSTDWRVHYGWCRGVDRDQAENENDARHETLSQCSLRHEHDEGDYYDHDRYDREDRP